MKKIIFFQIGLLFITLLVGFVSMYIFYKPVFDSLIESESIYFILIILVGVILGYLISRKKKK